MNHEEGITKILKLDWKLQLKVQVYVVMAMNIYLWKELLQSERMPLKVNQIILSMER